MGSRLTSHLVALCLPVDPDRADDLAANTGLTLTSSYTEAGPRPGACVPSDAHAQLVPVVSGGQGADLELVVLRGGQALLDVEQGVQLGYRFDGETDAQVRGWLHPGFLVAWALVLGDGTADVVYHDIACDAAGRLIVVGVDANGYYSGRLDPSTSYSWDTSVDPERVGALVPLPDGRVLMFAQSQSWITDDGGATWTRHSVYRDDGPDPTLIPRAAYRDGAILLCQLQGASDDELVQLASDDLGQSWSEVFVASSAVGTSLSVQALPTGGFIVGYIRESDDHACVRILSSAWQSFDDATAIVVRADASADMVVVADADGLLWCYVTDGTNKHEVELYYSDDSGQTWTQTANGAMRVATGATRFLTGFAACPFNGGVALAHRMSISSLYSADRYIGVAVLGGWSTLTDIGDDSRHEPLVNRVGFGPRTISGSNTCYLPFEAPATSGFWSASGGGSESFASGVLNITTAAATRYYSDTFTTDFRTLVYQIRVQSGGDLADDDIIAAVRVANGSSLDRQVKVRHATTGFRVIDANDSDATLATVTLDIQTSGVEIAIRVDPGSGNGLDGVWYRRIGAPEWTRAWQGTATTAGSPAANGLVLFGHFATSTGSSRWGPVRHSPDRVGDGVPGTTDYYLRVGRPTSILPTPLDVEAGDGTRAAYLSATGGPGALGEVYDVPVDHDYPVEHLLPTRSPSPAERWRSTSKTAQQVLCWDYGIETWAGDSIALVVQRANFRQAALQYYDGSTWQTAGTLDLGAEADGLSWSRTGDTLIPSGTGNLADRYWHEGELAGGLAILTVTSVDDAVEDEFGVASDATITGTVTDGANGILVSDANYLTVTPPNIGAGEYHTYLVRMRVAVPTRDNYLVARSSISTGGVDIWVDNNGGFMEVHVQSYDSGGSAVGAARTRVMASLTAGQEIWLAVTIREDSDPNIGAVRIQAFNPTTGAELDDSTAYGGSKPSAGDFNGTLRLGRGTSGSVDASEVLGDGMQWAVFAGADQMTEAEIAAFITSGSNNGGEGAWHYAELGTVVTQVGRRIRWNTAGRWGPSTGNAARPRVILEGVDGTEDASGTSGVICAPSGVMIAHLSSVQRRRYWRVTVAADQVTPAGESYYEAGILTPLAVRALGAPPDWGWTRDRAPNAETRRSRYGTTRARRLGPTVQTWTLGWPSGVDLFGLRGDTAPDYLGSSVGLPLISAEDVPWLVGGLLELADSGAVPVVALAAVPDASGTTITDPSLWLYGRLTASVRQDHLVGTEGSAEVVRMPDLVVEEIV